MNSPRRNQSLLKPALILSYMLTTLITPLLAGLTFSDNGTYVTCTGWGPDNPVGVLEIPATHNGKPVAAIGVSAFEYDTGITGVVIPDSVNTIGTDAFGHCSGITSVTFPPSVTTIGQGAFALSGLRQVTIPATVTAMGGHAFDSTPLTSVTISPGVTVIGTYQFARCGSLSAVTIPSSVTDMREFAFFECTGLTSVTITPGVTAISMGAFNGCSGLTDVIIPSSVTTIGGNAFDRCSKLKSVSFQGNAPVVNQNAFLNTASGFAAYFVDGMSGFGTPVWAYYYAAGSTCAAFPGSSPQFSSPIPPAAGKVGVAYTHACYAGNSPAPAFAVTSGSLPDGLYIDRAGVISGTPTTRGIFAGTITASNGFGPEATQGFTIDTNEYKTLAANGQNGTVAGGGVFVLNSTAAITATANPGYLFNSWSGDAIGAENPLLVLMDADKTVTASFTPDTGDDDEDGLTNYQEIVQLGTNPALQDTDGDNVKDKDDAFPLNIAEWLDTDGDGTGDNADTDDDGDGYSDEDEINIHGTNPTRADSDGDGLSDPQEIQTHLTNPNLADTDSDGLSDGAEITTHGTLPKVADTDGDGFLDGYEVLTGKSPLDILDKPALVAEARTAIEFTFPSALGKTYRIEDSLDLETWGTVESGIAGNGGVIQRFYTTRNLPKRYFRVEED